MISQPKIGLVTVLYNGKEVLPGFFESLNKQKYKNLILYVVDNSPNDDALVVAKDLSEKINISSFFIKNDDNYGVAKGNNQGIEAALNDSCEYVLLLNNDIEFGEDTLSDIVGVAEAGESIVVPKIYYFGTNKLWMAGGDLLKKRGTSVHFGYGKEDDGSFNNARYIGYAPTCFMLISREVFGIVGCMDEKYFVYYDDTDFIYRAVDKSFKIKYEPKIVVHHKVSFSTGGESDFSLYYKTRNRVYFCLKNLSLFDCCLSILYLVVTRMMRFGIYGPKRAVMVFKAMIEGGGMYFNSRKSDL